jgi:hypothetical protein
MATFALAGDLEATKDEAKLSKAVFCARQFLVGSASVGRHLWRHADGSGVVPTQEMLVGGAAVKRSSQANSLIAASSNLNLRSSGVVPLPRLEA